jgi:hypothetical protein
VSPGKPFTPTLLHVLDTSAARPPPAADSRASEWAGDTPYVRPPEQQWDRITQIHELLFGLMID